MAKARKAFPLAEAANLDSQISSTAQRLFGPGKAASTDLQTLKTLIERRAALLAPPAVTGSTERLRTIQSRLREQVEELRQSEPVVDA